MEQPQILKLPDYERLRSTLQPVYPLTKGLTKKMIQDAVQKVFADGTEIPETLPSDLLEKYGLLSRNLSSGKFIFP